ncbi:MAG: TatD family hydrolase [Defluviitaleaceae bacterium]|nr:TatD family hydrolase [Defluviitaleaceae bacterium]
MRIIDTHAHYDNDRYDDDRHEIITALPKNGVELVINIGCDMKTSKASVKLAEAYSHVYATVGSHPHYVKEMTEDTLAAMTKLAKSKKVVGFGEIGLDFFHNHSPQDTQKYWFKRLLWLVADLKLPAVIHSRDANDEVFKMIKSSPVRSGVIHAFSGDAPLAKAYVDMGFHIGIGGVVTFKKTDALQEAVAVTPLEKILLETDCPYLSPEPHRGKRNESAYLTYVAEKIAKIKGVTTEAVYAQTNENAKELFRL